MKDIVKKAIMLILLAGTAALAGCSSLPDPDISVLPSGEETSEEVRALGWAPDSVVSIVVPAASGGNTDLSARVFAQYARDLTGVDFIILNENGESGSVAADLVLASEPDGHTFLYGHTLVNMAYISGITDYDYTAFKLGPTFAKDPAQGLYVSSSEYSGLEEFLAAAKADPGKLRACTESGAYTYYELLAFQKAAGIELDLVNVGSNTEKIVAMLSSQCELMPGSYINTRDYLSAELFNCLGVPLDERSALMPDIPTFKEQGIDFIYPDQDFSFYFPPDTSDEVISFYEDLVQIVLADPEAVKAIADLSMEPFYLSAGDSAVNEEHMFTVISAIAGEVE